MELLTEMKKEWFEANVKLLKTIIGKLRETNEKTTGVSLGDWHTLNSYFDEFICSYIEMFGADLQKCVKLNLDVNTITLPENVQCTRDVR